MSSKSSRVIGCAASVDCGANTTCSMRLPLSSNRMSSTWWYSPSTRVAVERLHRNDLPVGVLLARDLELLLLGGERWMISSTVMPVGCEESSGPSPRSDASAGSVRHNVSRNNERCQQTREGLGNTSLGWSFEAIVFDAAASDVTVAACVYERRQLRSLVSPIRPGDLD